MHAAWARYPRQLTDRWLWGELTFSCKRLMAFCQSPSKVRDDNYSSTIALAILSQTTSHSTQANKHCFISFMGFHGQSSMALYGDVLKKSLTLDIRMSSRAAALSAGEVPLPARTRLMPPGSGHSHTRLCFWSSENFTAFSKCQLGET